MQIYLSWLNRSFYYILHFIEIFSINTFTNYVILAAIKSLKCVLSSNVVNVAITEL